MDNLEKEERLLKIAETKKTSKRICASYLWYIILQSLLVVFFVFAIVRLTWGFSDAYLALTTYGMIAAVVVTTIFVVKRYTRILDFKIPMATKGDWDAKFILKATAVFVGLSVGVSFIMTLVVNLIEAMGVDYPIINPISFTDDVAGNIAVVILACVSAPIFEELYFRGIILHGLKRHGYLFAILVSSIVFAFSHQGLPAVSGIFVAALGLGYISLKTNSIVPGMIVHAINNLIAVFEVFLYDSQYVYICWAIEALAVVYALYFVFKHRHDIKAYINEHKGVEIATFFMSWQGIIVLILLVSSILPSSDPSQFIELLS